MTSMSSPSIPYTYAKPICNQVLELDKSIRFACIANNMRTLIAYKLREGLVPLLIEEELENNIIKKNCPSHKKTGKTMNKKMGDVIYTFALYKRLKGASIPLDDGHHPDLAVSSSGVI